MPKVFRSMYNDDGAPLIGDTKCCLGIIPGLDVHPDENGNVNPEVGRGLSVAPGLQQLPPRLVPRRLAHLRKSAMGDDRLAVWEIGEGPFLEGTLAADLPNLIVRPDSRRHGTVGPAQVVPLLQFQQFLADTRDRWQSIERGG